MISIAYKLLFFALISSAISFEAISEPSHTQSNNSARGLLNNSLSFLRQKIEESGFALNSQDISLIKKDGNTFIIPKQLRIKGLASIPIIEQQVKVKRIALSGKQESNTGFSVNIHDPKCVISSLGIKSGDILYKVNNEVLKDTKTATQIFNKIKMSDEILVTLFRDNKIVNYLYKFV